mgnify:CR=1 FL=1
MSLSFSTIRNGSRGDDVLFAQRVLGVFLNWPDGLTQDGIFWQQHRKMCEAVPGSVRFGTGWYRWQQYLAVPCTYVVCNYNEWNAEDAIHIIQSAMGISADGIWGPQTTAAVKNFQRSHGLADDGIWGRQCWTVWFYL